MKALVAEYVATWRCRGYSLDLPDEVVSGLMRENLAPSYKAICFAILKNDAAGISLGFTPRPSRWYGALKRIELGPDCRTRGRAQASCDPNQLDLIR